jgi:pimeloyl-ACP methyl ester carboxylesterase
VECRKSAGRRCAHSDIGFVRLKYPSGILEAASKRDKSMHFETIGYQSLLRTNLQNATYCAPGHSSEQALYFDSGDQRLSGWLYGPSSGPQPRFGLVICKPFGREEMSAHRSVRAFAKEAATLAVPSLLFDYLGTGDSADIDPLANQLDVWTRDVLAAVAELQLRTGVEQVGLVGFRLGALLAAQAACQCKAVNALLLVAPVISGQGYLRELRVIRHAASLDPRSANPNIEGYPDNSVEDIGPIEVNGHLLSSSTIEALAHIDLALLAAPPVPNILVIDDNSVAKARAWTESLSRRGGRTQYLTLPRVAYNFMTEPQFAAFPQELIGVVSDWLRQLRHQQSTPTERDIPQHLDAGSPPAAPELVLPTDKSASNAVLTERPVYLSSSAVVLHGIITEPPHGEKTGRAVILLNSGAVSHTGPNRLYVSLSRSWARRGYTTLRLDMAGLGDSDARSWRPDSHIFPPEALDDIRCAIEFIRARYAINDISLGGICSGAYHALQAAIAGLPVNRILLINPRQFLWTERLWKEGIGDPDAMLRSVYAGRSLEYYFKRAISSNTWIRLLTGRLTVGRHVRTVLARPFVILQSILRDWARRLRIRLPRDLGWELEDIGARGVRMVFVFAYGEPGLEMLRIQGGSSVARLGERCSIHTIHEADHTFSKRSAQAALESCLSYDLAARHCSRGAEDLGK